MDERIFSKLPGALLPWYWENRRELPWRENREPYRVWVSEIMLQQTRVEAVKGYYARFLRRLPTIEDLAACDDDTLAKLWEGLGYYSRVRNMKKAAKTVVERYGGRFPREYEDVLSLPGIGAYTAGAICSICFDLPTPAVDGNVLRVVSRLTEDFTPVDQAGYKDMVRLALTRIYPPQAGDFTQALMELGATVCGPNRAPACGICPCAAFCKARASGRAGELPVKRPKRKRTEESYTVFVLSCDGRFALEKRPGSGLLSGLWQFPNVPGILETEAALAAIETMGLRPKEMERMVERKHIFTHVRWDMRGVYVRVAEQAGTFHWLTAGEIEKEAALPTAFRQFWEEARYV